MPRLFFGNFDFEHRLVAPDRNPSAVVRQRLAELASTWLSIADDGDWIWTPLSWEPEFLPHLIDQLGGPRVRTTNRWSDLPAGLLPVPWGWSAEALKTFETHGLNVLDGSEGPPPLESARQGNSRRFSWELEIREGVAIPGACRIERVEDAANGIARLPNDAGWVIKAEFGMSGRERILGHGPLNDSQARWLAARLTQGSVAFFEPWLTDAHEAGCQWEIPRAVDGPPRFLGFVPLISSAAGQYAGSVVAANTARHIGIAENWRNDAIARTETAAWELQQRGYHGPLGIDVMTGVDPWGERRLRPFQDINARWTMGRLALGWRRFPGVPPAYRWLHSMEDEKSHICNTLSFVTSPGRAGGRPATLTTRLIPETGSNPDSSMLLPLATERFRPLPKTAEHLAGEKPPVRVEENEGGR